MAVIINHIKTSSSCITSCWAQPPELNTQIYLFSAPFLKPRITKFGSLLMRSLIQAAEISFLQREAGLCLRYWVRNLCFLRVHVSGSVFCVSFLFYFDSLVSVLTPCSLVITLMCFTCVLLCLPSCVCVHNQDESALKPALNVPKQTSINQIPSCLSTKQIITFCDIFKIHAQTWQMLILVNKRVYYHINLLEFL